MKLLRVPSALFKRWNATFWIWPKFSGQLTFGMVVSADAAEIERRIRSRGDVGLIERALFLKQKLEAMPENQGHLFDNTGKTIEETIREIDPDRFRVL